MSHERAGSEEISPSVEHTAEMALLLMNLEAESLAGNFEKPEQKKWADGFTAISRVLEYATTTPAAAETVGQEHNPS